MKFNTKTLSPMPASPEHCFVLPNKFIPTSREEDSNDDESWSDGRRLYYKPTLVYTAVLGSSRIHQDQINNNSGRKKLLLEEDLDCLNQKLESLFISSAEETPKVEGIIKKEVDQPTKDVDENAGLGRCPMSAGHGKTVIRSLRLSSSSSKPIFGC
jgi:hypothetical protein